MASVHTSLVDILREFLKARLMLQRLAERYRRDELSFAELQGFVGDDEGSVLFRLKEKCHALFRPEAGGTRQARVREALFDLAVGSLFHEAIKFREEFYQREVYGPRVRALRDDAGPEASGLFVEFERILSTVSVRLEEGFAETRSLMDQSWEQLRLLLADQKDPGFVTRFLIENGATLEELGSPLEAVLEELHGETGVGYEIAGRSYLTSGHYEAAHAALQQATARGRGSGEVQQLSAYASGMSAYLTGEYGQSIERLGEWVDGGSAESSSLAGIARAALSSLDRLVGERDREAVLAASAKLLEKIGQDDESERDRK